MKKGEEQHVRTQRTSLVENEPQKQIPNWGNLGARAKRATEMLRD